MEEQVTSIWTKTDEGWRFYIEDEDRWAKSEWVSLNPHRYANDTEQRYYIDANGYAVKGWKLIDGNGITSPHRAATASSKDRATNRLRWMSRSILKK